MSLSPPFINYYYRLPILNSMIRLSQTISDCSSADLASNNQLLGYTKGSKARIVQTKDLNLVAEFTFPEEVGQIKFSEDALKFFVLNK